MYAQKSCFCLEFPTRALAGQGRDPKLQGENRDPLTLVNESRRSFFLFIFGPKSMKAHEVPQITAPELRDTKPPNKSRGENRGTCTGAVI